MIKPSLLIVDLFCGAGGTSTGFSRSKTAKVIACVNHDHVAILSHRHNHPNAKHFEEDIRTVGMDRIIEVILYWKSIYPDAKVVLWASLECTNFSKAKGGLAREADSRTLVDSLHRYINAYPYDYVMIENVIEFLDWGPLQIKPKRVYVTEEGYDATELTMIKDKHKNTVHGWMQIPEKKGDDFRRWTTEMCAHGFKMDWRSLNSADFGASTNRPRLFGMFARPELPVVWPTITHVKTDYLNKLQEGKHQSVFNYDYSTTCHTDPTDKFSFKNFRSLPYLPLEQLQPWEPVKHKLDFENVGYSIFDRSRNMSLPKKLQKDICPATFKRVYDGLMKNVAEELDAYIIKYHGGESRIYGVDQTMPVLDCGNRFAILSKTRIDPEKLSFLGSYHGTGYNMHPVSSPSPVVAANDGLALYNMNYVGPLFIDRHFSSGCSSAMTDPAGSIMTEPKMSLVQGEFAFIDSTNFTNVPTSVHNPLGVITASGHVPMLLNPAWGGHSSSVEDPCGVIVASQDKSPISLALAETGELALEIFEYDIEIVRKLKYLMAALGIVDIKMRMLTVRELLSIQGFPDSYLLSGSQREQKKFIGNSVVPHVVCDWSMAIHKALMPYIPEETLKAA